MDQFYQGQQQELVASGFQVSRFFFKFKACHFLLKCKALMEGKKSQFLSRRQSNTIIIIKYLMKCIFFEL